ncbi:ATP-binding protein [Aquiflexum gelatinilyticum]|uniref:ATP-binding protein n=1 Tax=Aquiflexum gelatinilyticum TaxID=2961943 RepID=A0A9X2PC52_9BACT|nr:ATP-binding protein [Aquiflexum gelatinilyticum]MCR9016919.1 ATP-binding protein [Aquiflexum gelatinilyticum]MCS4433770.1 ATP-binding protein [Aquiflexum gelatinilyticum]
MLKKVVIIGPESTGKSTLAKNLADHFGCLWVPEFAREYLDNLDRPYAYDDLTEIAKEQIGLEDEFGLKSKDLLVCDTDLNVIKVWSNHKYGRVHPWIEDQIKTRKYDLYLLTDIDIPWKDDPQREHPDPFMRKYFFDLYQKILLESGVPFALVSGNQEDRMQLSIDFIHEKLI